MVLSVINRFRKEAIILFVTTIISVLFVKIGYPYLTSLSLASVVYSDFVKLIGWTISKITFFLITPIFYNEITNQLEYLGHLFEIKTSLSFYPFYLLFVLFGFSLPKKRIVSIVVYLSTTIFFIYIISILFNLSFIYLKGSLLKDVVFELNILCALPVFFWLQYMGRSNHLLNYYYIKINVVIQKVALVPIEKVILLILLTSYLPEVIISCIGLGGGLQVLLLSASKFMLSVLGYSSIVVNETIFLNNVSLELKNFSSLVMIITIVATLIWIVKGDKVNKLIYTILFVLLMGFFCSVYNAGLLVLMQQNLVVNSVAGIKMNTWVMTFLASFLLILYMLWFNGVRLRKRSDK